MISVGLKIATVVFLVLGIFALTLSVVWHTVYFKKVLEGRIKQNVQISPDKRVFQTWSKTPIPIFTEYRFFNVLNPEEVIVNKSTPLVEEVGPYVYRQYREKVNITFNEDLKKVVKEAAEIATKNKESTTEDHPNIQDSDAAEPMNYTDQLEPDEIGVDDTVSYYMRKTFVFDEELSSGSESDVLTLLNVPFAGIANKLRAMTQWEIFKASFVVASARPTFFTNRTVDEMLYGGYYENLIDAIQTAKQEIILPNAMFGLYYNKNGTLDPPFTVNRGRLDNSDYCKISSYNDSSKLPFWRNDTCNELKGTDGGQYSPFPSKEEPLYFFMTELCRSGYLMFSEETELDGIPLYRYRISKSFLDAPDLGGENYCYCANPGMGQCNVSGIMDIGPCKKGAPIVISQPHFLNTIPPLYERIDGLNPDPELHDTYVDVDPITGAVMRAERKLQMNIKVNPVSGIPYYKDVKPMIFPVVWINEKVQLTPELIAKYKEAVQKPVNLLASTVLIAYLVSFGLLIIALILGLCICFKQRNSSKRESINIRMAASSEKKGPAGTALLGQNGNHSSNHC